MATTSSNPKVARRTLVDLPISNVTPQPATASTALSLAASQDRILVNVPKDYRLTLDDGTPIQIHAGVQMMPRALADHWWSRKANGVVDFDPEANASVKA